VTEEVAIFEEREPGLLAAILIPLIAFMLIFPVWHLGERDLYWTEGEYAAVAQEMGSFPPAAMAHGEIMPDVYPLFPLLASKLHKLSGASMEFCLRFLSVISLAGLGAIVWEACRRTMGLQAAAAGCAMMISTILVAEKAIDGYPHMMALLLTTSGWLLWFTFGQSRGDWDAAWVSAGLFGGLAFYCNGWEALACYIVPFLFMRRPLSIWSKLNRPGFYTGLALLTAFILIWAIPRWRAGLGMPNLRASLPIDSGISFSDYLEQLAVFPFEAVLRFMPWTLLIWVPFCAAIVPLDKNPLFSRFLKTILVTLFLYLWLVPETQGRDILVLAPPMAMLVAMHYWIAARRHGDAFLWFVKWGALAGFLLSLGCLAFYLLPLESLKNFLPSFSRDLSYKDSPALLVRGLVEVSVALLLAASSFWLAKTRSRVWVALLCLFACGMMLFWAVANPYKANDRSRSKLGRQFYEALANSGANVKAPGFVVYKDSLISGLYSECEYLDCKVRKLNATSLSDQKDKEVYVIALEVPSVPERVWTNLLPPETRYKDRRICLWKGVLKEDRRNDAVR
jgi:hypothetical protein